MKVVVNNAVLIKNPMADGTFITPKECVHNIERLIIVSRCHFELWNAQRANLLELYGYLLDENDEKLLYKAANYDPNNYAEIQLYKEQCLAEIKREII